MKERAEKLTAIRERIMEGALKIERSRVNGDIKHRLPGNVSLCFEGIEGESLLLMLDLINEGRLKVDSREMKEYLGHVANKRGDCFNEKVFEKLSTINGIIVRKKIKKINGKKVAAENGQDLGDIDVLIIKPDRKKIIVVETKDFSFSKTPYEMHQEYFSVFCDDGKKLCYISKHKRRLLWLQEHISDLLQQYSLANGNWKVQDLLITSDSITSNEFYHQKQKILLFSEITASNIHKL